MGTTAKLRKLIKIYWYIIGGLSLLFIYNCSEYLNYLYANPEMWCRVVVADKQNYVRFVHFFERKDGSIAMHTTGTAYWNIYTGEDEYISADNYSFDRRGKLEYYSIDEQKVYSAHLPPDIDKEIKKVLMKRRSTKKEVRHCFTIYRNGEVGIQVKEIGNGDHYYKNDIVLYTNSYLAKSYPPDDIFSTLDEVLYIDYSAFLPQLLKKKYNWALRITWTDDVSDEIKEEIRTVAKDKIRMHDIATDAYSSTKYIYGLAGYEHTTKFLLNDLKIGEQYIKFDVRKMDEAFEKLYEGCDPCEKSYIKVQLNDQLKANSIYLIKDDKKIELPHTIL